MQTKNSNFLRALHFSRLYFLSDFMNFFWKYRTERENSNENLWSYYDLIYQFIYSFKINIKQYIYKEVFIIFTASQIGTFRSVFDRVPYMAHDALKVLNNNKFMKCWWLFCYELFSLSVFFYQELRERDIFLKSSAYNPQLSVIKRWIYIYWNK